MHVFWFPCVYGQEKNELMLSHYHVLCSLALCQWHEQCDLYDESNSVCVTNVTLLHVYGQCGLIVSDVLQHK